MYSFSLHHVFISGSQSKCINGKRRNICLLAGLDTSVRCSPQRFTWFYFNFNFILFCMKQVTTNHLLSETTSKLLNFKNAVFLKTWFHQAKTRKGNTFVNRVEMGISVYFFYDTEQLKIL